MRTITILVFIHITGNLFCQNLSCDTIKLNDGSSILAKIQKETKSKYVYFKCCETCSVPREIKKNDVASVVFSESFLLKKTEEENIIQLEKERKDSIIQFKKERKDSIIQLKKEWKDSIRNVGFPPLSANLELGGRGILGSINVEYQFLRYMSIGLGAGRGIDEPNANASILFKLGRKHQFIPHVGFVSEIRSNPETNFTLYLGYQNNFGDKESFNQRSSRGYFRVSPGLLIFPDDLWFPFLPWIGLTLGINLIP